MRRLALQAMCALAGLAAAETTFGALDKTQGNFSGTFVLRPANYLLGSAAMTFNYLAGTMLLFR